MGPERRPNRVLGGIHDQFWAHCAAGDLRIQKCTSCGAYSWPPSDECERCDGDALVWEKVSGRGQLISWCTFHQKYYETLPTPWDTILVELAEGPLFVSDPEGFTNAEARLGLEVCVAFKDCVDDGGTFRLPVFRILPLGDLTSRFGRENGV